MVLRRDIVVLDGGEDKEISVWVPDASVPFTDLLIAVGLEPGPSTVDGRLVPATASILDARLRTGSVVSAWTKAPAGDSSPTIAVLEHIGGLRAGGSVALGTGEYVVGPSNEPGIEEGVPDEVTFRLTIEPSRRVRIAPAAATVKVADRALTATTDLAGDVVSVGGTLFRVRVPGQAEVAEDDTRTVTAATPDEVAVRQTRSRRGLWLVGAAAVLFLIAIAAAPPNIVVPVAATLAILVGLWWLTWQAESRWRASSQRRSPQDADLVTTPSSRSSARPDLAAELRAEYPSIAEIVSGSDNAVRPPDHTRIRSDLEVVVAYGHLDGPTGRLTWAPVVANLERGPIAVLGPRRAVLAVARAVILVVAAGSSPGRMPIALGHRPADDGEWEWLKWLPHVRSPLSEGASPFVVLDKQAADDDPTSAGRQLLANHTTGVIIAHPGDTLPPFCRQILNVSADGSATFVGAETLTDLCAVGVGRSIAQEAARGMCRTIDHLSVADLDVGRRPRGESGAITVEPYELHRLAP